MPEQIVDATPTSRQRVARPTEKSSRLAAIALVAALAAAGMAGWAVMRPPASTSHSVEPIVTAEQRDEARTAACTAFSLVKNAVYVQTHADPGTDVSTAQSVAANARLAMLGGGAYLAAHIAAATPADLADAINAFSDDLQGIALSTLAGVADDDQVHAGRLRDAEAVSTRIAELCT